MPALAAPTMQSKLNRLQSLTTQLLWRLQQSSPYHTSAKTDLVVPSLGDAREASFAPDGIRELLPGLQESQGALYELGVSDDGTLVGITDDELEESLATLGTMASSLGCKVDVLRKVMVGNCQWTEEALQQSETVRLVHNEQLWVAEAQVVPALHSRKQNSVKNSQQSEQGLKIQPDFPKTIHDSARRQTEQVRFSLTGSTTSGKSSLLGTLSTSTHDNSRGKSRLSLLKHRHEISSGVTSSIVTEMIGYPTNGAANGKALVNFASGNVSSWNDIHSTCDVGRLAVLSDSAGHPRYRRTTVRGLMSLAPHWTMCCIAADNDKHDPGKAGATASSQNILGSSGADIDLSRSHLELCLALRLPLVVIITKLDLASNMGLRETLKKTLTTLKAAGRQPVVLQANKDPEDGQQLQKIPHCDEMEVNELVSKMNKDSLPAIVPIVLTSAVTGVGVCKVHALLRQLPIQSTGTQQNTPDSNFRALSKAQGIFHVDEVFVTSNANSLALLDGSKRIDGHILSGHLSSGTLHIGDILFAGPFNRDPDLETQTEHAIRRATPGLDFLAPNVMNTAIANSQQSLSENIADPDPTVTAPNSSSPAWRRVRVVSLRNLRLPVRQLYAGQVGTVGIAFETVQNLGNDESARRPASSVRVRKGMVLLRGTAGSIDTPPLAYRGFKAMFDSPQIVSVPRGASVIVYIASIRASARISSINEARRADVTSESDEEISNFDGPDVRLDTAKRKREFDHLEVTFEFLASREWFERGNQVLVMPERADAGGVGLEGFVGFIKEGLP